MSDNVGFFVLPAVPSTEYRLYAFESLDPNDIFDPAFAERFQNRETFIYRKWEYELGKWVVKKVFSSAIASEAAWCAGNTIAVRERCYLTVIPADVVDRQ